MNPATSAEKDYVYHGDGTWRENTNVKVDGTTIAKDDSDVISVIPGGIIDNDTIVLDEDGKLAARSIPFDTGDLFNLYASSTYPDFPHTSNTTANSIVITPVLGDQSMIKTFSNKQFGHVDNQDFVFDEDGNYIVYIYWGISTQKNHTGTFDNRIFLQSDTGAGYSNISSVTTQSNSEKEYVSSAVITYPGVFKSGDKLRVVLDLVLASPNTNDVGTVGFGIRIMKIPVTNEYQVSNSKIQPFHSNNSFVIELPETGRATIPFTGFEFTGSALLELGEDQSYVTVLESGCGILTYELWCTFLENVDILVRVEVAQAESPDTYAVWATNTLHFSTTAANSDVVRTMVCAEFVKGQRIRITVEAGTGNVLRTAFSQAAGSLCLFSSITSGDSIDVPSVVSVDIPVGSIIYSASSTPPEGYLVCNGAAVGRTTYPDLFGVIGTIYGAGDGSTTFNLPNLVGRVAQGGASPGQYLEAGLPNITGVVTGLRRMDTLHVGASGALYWAVSTESSKTQTVSDSNIDADIALNAAMSNAIYGRSSTVQPPALTLLPCIKY